MCSSELEREEYPYTPPANSGSGSGGSGGGSGNGNNFNAHNNKSQQNTSATYVLNKSTKKFHRPSCRDVPKIASQNYGTSNATRQELISMGYSACGHCNP
ncbi:MAG: hypothetical protein NC131_08975 [Roseburia sp.]|nr:hypothetical protein [Roseburia sp.]